MRMVLRSILLAGAAAMTIVATPNGAARAADEHARHMMKGMSRFLTDPIVIKAALSAATDKTPLYDNLGSLHMPITTGVPEAQSYFDQGVRLSYAFNHAEARRAFREGQRLDPSCAMCFWGEALVLGPNINAPMSPDDVAPAIAAIAAAQKLGGGTDKEKDLIQALAARYSPDPKADRAPLDAAYAQAMTKVASRFSDDENIASFAAEAIMDTQPWDYWSGAAGSRTTKGRASEAIALVEGVLAKNPDHAGSIHLYIHLMEASDHPEKAEPFADRLGGQEPGAGHLVHMPGHIYLRVGRYLDSLKSNQQAVKVDEAFFARVDDRSIYRGAYYPHNVHFVLVSAQMAGDGKTALDAANKLATVISDETAATVAWTQPVKAAPYYAHVQFGVPDAVLALPDPGNTFPFVKGNWHYARGVALATKGDLEGAGREADAIEAIANTANLSFLIDNLVPGDDLLHIARHIVLARIAAQKGYDSSAIDELRQAVALQDLLPYQEPPYWYYPVRQSLGAAYLKAGRAKEAVATFKTALKETPNNGWAIYGLSEAQKKLGDASGLKASETALSKTWVGPPSILELSKL